MKILVYPHDLGMGGSQLNAIELAAATRDLGHEVAVYGQPGILNARIAELGLDFIESPTPGRRPSLRVARDLRRISRERGIEVIHGYEWPPTLEARIAVVGTSVACVSTVMSMAVAPFIPWHVPLVVGTEQIAAAERALGRRNVTVIEPPVDVVHNAPGLGLDIAGFRSRHGIPSGGLHVVCVTRLARELKLEGLLVAITEVPKLSDDVTLTIVGDGPARDEVRGSAGHANEVAGRRAVVLTGEVSDPRPAYEMADVVLGMGGSALRALAFAKPLIVQGEQGYWQTLTPDTFERFLWTGWYGVGTDPAEGASRLWAELDPLLSDSTRRLEWGQFGHELVVARFSLSAAARCQTELYAHAASDCDRPQRSWGLGDLRAATQLATYKGDRVAKRLRKSVSADDFNAKSLTTGISREARPQSPAVAYFPGVAWDGIPGTDHQMAQHLAQHAPVLWVDPPRPITRWLRPHPGVVNPNTGLTQVADNIWRLHVIVPPGVTRPVLRALAHRTWLHAVRRTCAGPWGNSTAIVSNAAVDLRELPFPRSLYYVTDDFAAGAELLGIPVRRAEYLMKANAQAADLVLAVSPVLVERLGGPNLKTQLLPNGCTPEVASPANVRAVTRLNPPIAGVVGQLNDRLDVSLLLRLARENVNLLLVGPRYDQNPSVRTTLDELIRMPNVEWVGRVPQDEVSGYIHQMAVGLTPYADSSFNRSSFPLKTLQYLASGRRVVSTDLPSSRWLGTPLVDVARDQESFIRITKEHLAEGVTEWATRECLNFAARHSWSNRADVILHWLNSSQALPNTRSFPRSTYERQRTLSRPGSSTERSSISY